MKSLSAITISSLISVLAIGCQPMDDDGGNDQIDQALLAQYRAAMPDRDRLMAAAPEASTMAAVGDPALYPNASYDIVVGINGSVAGVIGLLELITSTDPTVYNSATREFFWGPWENDDGIGYVGAYIREAGPGADFQYEYAFLRGIDNDLANLAPVVWGAASPDPNNEDYGIGLTLWDFERNYDFEQTHNPNAGNMDFGRGRFATLWGHGADENNPGAELTFVVSMFRNFVPEDEPNADPADLDYFYGRFAANGDTVDFIDWEADMDVSDPADGLLESVGVRMAFFNEGTGRAEADASGGSLAAGDSLVGTECWDSSLARTYLQFEITGSAPDSYTEGDLNSCGFFASTLTELEVPALEDIDPALRQGLADLAETGAP